MKPDTLLAALRARQIDAAIVQRDAIPDHWTENFIAAFKEAKIPYLLELDDNLFSVPAEKDPKGRYATAAKELTILARHASGIIVSTLPLAEKMASIHKRIEIVPNLLSQAVWALPDGARQSEDAIRALYMGSFTHDQDLEMILPAMEEIASRKRTFRLRLIGISDMPLPNWVERVDLDPAVRNYPDFVKFLLKQRGEIDFAVAPLADTPFNSHKSDLKILEQGALGLPVLASDIGVFSGFRGVEGVTLVKNKVGSWIGALEARIDALDECERQGRGLRRWIHDHRALEPSLGNFDGLVADMLNIGDRE